MSQATNLHSIPGAVPGMPSRRLLLLGSAVALPVAVLASGGVAAPAESDDAELIRLCARLVALERQEAAIYKVRHTAEDEERTEPELDRLGAERETILQRLNEIGKITTLSGARAMAAAAISEAPKDRAGQVECTQGEDAEWLAFTVSEFLAGTNAGVIKGPSITEPATAAVFSDSELLRLCTAFHEHQAEMDAIVHTADDETFHAVLAARWSIIDAINDVSAVTDQGRRAKAKVAFKILDEHEGRNPLSSSTRFALAALADIAGGSAV